MNGQEKLDLIRVFGRQWIFKIPDYQRGYVWGPRQLSDFWGDLERTDPGRGHYTGVLHLEPLERGSQRARNWDDVSWLFEYGFAPYYVIDGQQRLITCIILIKAILDAVPDDVFQGVFTKREVVSQFICRRDTQGHGAHMLSYEPDNPSYAFLGNQILDDIDPDQPKTQTAYERNLSQAKRYFEGKLGEVNNPANILLLFTKLTQCLKFDLNIVPEEFDVFVAFETINNRGKPLSTLELLKNRLIYLSTLLQAATDFERTAVREEVKTCWRDIYECLGMNARKPLEDDEFLRNHWITYFEDWRRKEAGGVSVSLLERQFTRTKVIEGQLDLNSVRSYLASLRKGVIAWYGMDDPIDSGYPHQVIRWLQRLHRLGYRVFAPLVMASLAKLHDGAQADSVARVLEAIERYIFVVFELSQRRSDAGRNAAYDFARQVRCDEVGLEVVSNSISLKATELFAIDNFKTHIRDNYRSQLRKGYFGWDSLRYFLFEFENYLTEQHNGEAKLLWDRYTAPRAYKYTTEHIFPQQPQLGEWPAFANLNDEQRTALSGSLGNLLALSRSKNSALQNYAFSTKRDYVSQKTGRNWGYRFGSHSEIEISELPDWTPESIKDRGLAMLTFMEQRWNIPLGDDEEKTDLLFIGFL